VIRGILSSPEHVVFREFEQPRTPAVNLGYGQGHEGAAFVLGGQIETEGLGFQGRTKLRLGHGVSVARIASGGRSAAWGSTAQTSSETAPGAAYFHPLL
jgi:hypothetical protein